MEASRKKETSDLDVRHFIYTTFVETSRPPTTLVTANHFKSSIAAIESAYERLAIAHHIALAPGSHAIWMAHPFSSLPTNFVTEVDDKRYYGNGVWDVFGIAAMLGKNAVGHTPCGCGECQEKLDLVIRHGQPVESDWLVHFVVPAARFWEHIGYTGATILAFRSKDHLGAWLSRRNVTAGYEIPIQTCWELAQSWYSGRLEHDWQRPDQAKIQQLFDKLGLKGTFWDLGSTT